MSMDPPCVQGPRMPLRGGAGQNPHQPRCHREAVDQTGDFEADSENVAHCALDRDFAGNIGIAQPVQVSGQHHSARSAEFSA